jgi:hypothetical protein
LSGTKERQDRLDEIAGPVNTSNQINNRNAKAGCFAKGISQEHGGLIKDSVKERRISRPNRSSYPPKESFYPFTNCNFCSSARYSIIK